MTVLASGAATASAVAAAISASFAGATSVAAWLTIRGRRAGLEVAVHVGSPFAGRLLEFPMGALISIRVLNVRDLDLEVLDLWFESNRGRRVPKRWRRRPPRVSPLGQWFADGAGLIPGTVKARHTELYVFRVDQLGQALVDAGHGTYRPVVQAVGKTFRGPWFEAEAIPHLTSAEEA